MTTVRNPGRQCCKPWSADPGIEPGPPLTTETTSTRQERGRCAEVRLEPHREGTCVSSVTDSRCASSHEHRRVHVRHRSQPWHSLEEQHTLAVCFSVSGRPRFSALA